MLTTVMVSWHPPTPPPPNQPRGHTIPNKDDIIAHSNVQSSSASCRLSHLSPETLGNRSPLHGLMHWGVVVVGGGWGGR